MNVMLEPLPQEWNGYKINTDFRVGIRVSLALEDPELFEEERWEIILLLFFQNEDGSVREHPEGMELLEMIQWFLSGWNMDGKPEKKSQEKLVDYTVDQWRIYADFMQVYRIDLSKEKMHFWTFCGLLWNLPARQSSFLQVIEIRKKKPGPKATQQERKAIAEAQRVYGLGQEEKKLTQEEESKIDAFDAFIGKK